MKLGLILFAAVAAVATPAAADTRWYAYEADGPTARHRTGDLTVAVDRPLFGGARARTLYRRRGADLPLGGRAPFSAQALTAAIGGDAASLRVHSVDGQAGQGFSQGACGAVQPVWVALAEPRPFRSLRVHVLRRDEAGAPVLCETLDYRWRAEWDVPDRRRLPSEDPRPTPEPF